MAESKHTPAPWQAADEWNIHNGKIRVSDAAGEAVTDVWGGNEEAFANAHLIAAAPELLEALRPFAALAEFRDANDPGMPDGFVIAAYAPEFRGPVVRVTLGDCRRARALTAKAEGRS